MTPKKASDSLTVMTELVIPNDTNVLGNLRGGRLLHWMDIASAISAQKHASWVVVTASVDSVSFKQPILLGEVVTIRAQVTRAFSTSMEVFIEVWKEKLALKGNAKDRKKVKSNEAYYTFVALDDNQKPTAVPAIEAETDSEKAQYEDALTRREGRLKTKSAS